MNYKDIIKGLKCCESDECPNCEKCPYAYLKEDDFGLSCEERLKRDALEFIYRIVD